MKRFLLLVLVATLLSGGVAMGQNRKKGKRPTTRKARTENVQKKQSRTQVEVKNLDEQKETQKANVVSSPANRDERVIKEEVVFEKPAEGTDGHDEDKVFRSVEQMPLFPGGEVALMKYFASHINYPPMAAQNNVEGKVILQFVVKKDGTIGDVKVVRSVDKDLDKEAIRVIKSLPKFTPGRQNGKPVSVWYTVPVSFKLSQANKAKAEPARD